MSSHSYADDLRLAHVIADQVDSITMSRFRAQDLRVDAKDDHTPVSDADTTAEEYIRAQLGRARTRDAIVGEEYGTSGFSARRWIVDPIDGTRNYVRGVPVWATLIALAEDQDVVVGLVSAPALGRRWWAAKGAGAWTGRSLSQATRISVSGTASLDDAFLAYSSLDAWKELGRQDRFLDLMSRCDRTRGFGDFWSYMLVAEGACDLAAEPELALHDMAALVPIVTEAGGRFTSLDGEPGPWGGNAIATNGLLHEQARAYLA